MKRHWYTIKLSYMDNRGTELFSKTTEVGLVCQSDIIRHRALKKETCGFIREDKRIRKLLCSGKVNLEVVAYLGRFSGGPSLRQYIARMFGDLFTGYFIWQIRREL